MSHVQAQKKSSGLKEGELQFWQSTEKIDSEESYRLYLENFPDGQFSSLARVALKKIESERKSEEPVYKEILFPKPEDTGAFKFRVGDKFYGPGPIRIGRLGARKQILIPNGEWIVLAANDFEAKNATSTKMVSVIFGQLDASKKVVRSIVAVETNRLAVSMANQTNWPEMEACKLEWKQTTNVGVDAKKSTISEHGSDYVAYAIEFPNETCQFIRTFDIGSPTMVPAEPWINSVRNTSALAAEFDNLNWESTLFILDRYQSLLKVTRLDCVPNPSTGRRCKASDAKNDIAMPEAVGSRINWAKRYWPIAIQGMNKNIDAELLTPNEKRSGADLVFSLPD